MDCSNYYFLVEDLEDTILLGPYSLDVTYLEVLNDLRQRSNHFSAENMLRYVVPGKVGTNAPIRIEADMRHMMILHQAHGESVIVLKVTPEVEGRRPDPREYETRLEANHPSEFRASFDQVDPHMSSNVENIRIPRWWYQAISEIGQVFNDVYEFRMHLIYYAVAQGVDYDFVKNEKTRVTVKCSKAEMGCRWRVHASRLPNSNTFQIKTMNAEHTCGGGTSTVDHRRVTKHFLGRLFKTKLQTKPTYRPCDAVKDFHHDFGLKINYHRVWNGKEVAMSDLYGDARHSYEQLKWYMMKLSDTNPRSFTDLEADQVGRFRRFYMSLYASYKGFISGCRPLIFLDGTFLKDRYQGTLLAATALNGNGGLFPLALCVCNGEDASNWEWFMQHMRDMLYNTEEPYNPPHELVFLTDADKGLQHAIQSYFPHAVHSYCVNHVRDNFKNALTGIGLNAEQKKECANILVKSAYKYTTSGFRSCCHEMRIISQEAFEVMLNQYCPSKWSNVLFPGKRYGHLTSNCAESYNAWIREARTLPICQMVDNIRLKTMDLSNRRRMEALTWSTPICPEPYKILKKNVDESAFITVIQAHESVYEVLTTPSAHVDIARRSCSCKAWDVLDIPCLHACAVLRYIGQSVYSYTSQFFTAEYFVRTYSYDINPVPNEDRPVVDDENMSIYPPVTKKRRGRPKISRIPSMDKVPRSLHCSRCNTVGHNRKTCTAPLDEYPDLGILQDPGDDSGITRFH